MEVLRNEAIFDELSFVIIFKNISLFVLMKICFRYQTKRLWQRLPCTHTLFPFLQSTNLDSLTLNGDLKTESSQCNTNISTFANSGMNRKASLPSIPLVLSSLICHVENLEAFRRQWQY